MLQSGYILLILAVIVAALGGVLLFAVLRLSVAARQANRRLHRDGAETALLAGALQDAIGKLRERERATQARAEASERLSGEIIAKPDLGVAGGRPRRGGLDPEPIWGTLARLVRLGFGGVVPRPAQVWRGRARRGHRRRSGRGTSDRAENGCAAKPWIGRRRRVPPRRVRLPDVGRLRRASGGHLPVHGSEHGRRPGGTGAAIPDALLESELFGYERGAFTGAVARKPGKFEVADRGTLFLDEIGDLPLGLQGKILRALEERCFERVGGVALLHVDVRLVAATNHNLRASVAARRFREDLFFRLSVFPITIPPLRERPGDIALLANCFLDRLRKELKKRMLTLSTSAVEAMQRYNWPGNVRELQNCLERAAILVDGDTIHPQDLSLSFPASSAEVPADADPWDELDLSGSLTEASRRILAEVERRKIQQALREASSNKGRTAEILQISTRMLGTKLREYRIE